MITQFADQLKKYQDAFTTVEEKTERIETLEVANKRLKSDLESLTEEYHKLLHECEQRKHGTHIQENSEQLANECVLLMKKNFESTLTRLAVKQFGSIEEYASSPLNAYKLLMLLFSQQKQNKKSMKKEIKRGSPATSPRKYKEIWTDVLSQKNILECLSKSQRITLKQQYNNYVSGTPGYFDPSAKYGASSITNMERKGEGARYKLVVEDKEEPKGQLRPYKPQSSFSEKVGWFSAKDYFANNGTGSAIYRSPSPNKITTKSKPHS